MASNSFGHLFRITTSGESHGMAMAVIVDGCPAGLHVDMDYIQHQLDRRRPGQSALTTSRNEADRVSILSGVYEGVTTGAPILMTMENQDMRSADYDQNRNTLRPSHADYTYYKKYGLRDHRGGGRSSARETANWVAAGALAQLFIHQYDIKIHAGVTAVGDIRLEKPHTAMDWSAVEKNAVRCPDNAMAQKMMDYIAEIKQAGDTVGGLITCVIEGCPAGLGEPVFQKLHAELGRAMLSINACKGFEYGSGFEAARMKGSQHNDLWEKHGEKMTTSTNYSGGIQGGISNGMPIYFTAAFKPVSTLMMSQLSIDTEGQPTMLEGKGRHDPCVVPRAVPVVEALAALVIADYMLLAKAYRP